MNKADKDCSTYKYVVTSINYNGISILPWTDSFK